MPDDETAETSEQNLNFRDDVIWVSIRTGFEIAVSFRGGPARTNGASFPREEVLAGSFAPTGEFLRGNSKNSWSVRSIWFFG